jgi:hypothetical protein
MRYVRTSERTLMMWPFEVVAAARRLTRSVTSSGFGD